MKFKIIIDNASLHIAVANNNIEIVKMLLSHQNIDVNNQTILI